MADGSNNPTSSQNSIDAKAGRVPKNGHLDHDSAGRLGEAER